jgi:branched-chain amino acid transport system ATP-binding protein
VTLLATRQLESFYGDFQVLFGVDFEIAAGEVVALIGANGAGKSTFLKTICGVLGARRDAVMLDGHPVGGLAPGEIVRRGVAMVPEGRRLFPSLSAEEMSNPQLLLCDELSLGLAPIVVKQIYDALPAICEGGMTVVIVEQDVATAQRVSSRLYCLQEGRVTLTGASAAFTREQISQAYFGV